MPFNRFPEVDTLLGPEMRSTGEVMGIDRTFGMAFAKSQAGAGNTLPQKGTVFLSLADRDKAAGLVAARRFAELGFSIAATAGTAAALEAEGITVETIVAKVGESRAGADAVDLISSRRSRPDREHAPGPRAARRRHAHPAGRDRARRAPASPRSPPPSRRRRASPRR